MCGPPRIERLDDARAGLAKRRRTQQETVPGQLQVGDVERLNTSPPTVKLARSLLCELLAQTEVGVEERITEPIVRRKRQSSVLPRVVLACLRSGLIPYSGLPATAHLVKYDSCARFPFEGLRFVVPVG